MTGNAKPEIYLMRHAKAHNNVLDVHSGGLPETIVLFPKRRVPFLNPLTEEGVRQVKKTVQLSDLKIDLIFSSPFLRAEQTAEIISKETGLTIVIDPRLSENNSGIFNGMHESFAWDWLRRQKDFFQTAFPEGESLQDFYNRIIEFYWYVNKNHSGQKILVVSHEFGLTIMEMGGVKGKTIREVCQFRKSELKKENKGLLIRPAQIRKIQ